MFEKKYRVVKLEQMGRFVEMMLKQVEEFEEPLPPQQFPVPITVGGESAGFTVPTVQEPKTDEERLVKRTLDALKKFGFIPIPSHPGGFVSEERPIYDLILTVTPEEYMEMGSPALLSTIKIKFMKER